MQKVYVGILLSALFCSMNAMEADLPTLLANVYKNFHFEERLEEKRKAFEEAISCDGDVQHVGEDILIMLRNWCALTPGKEKKDNMDAVLTLGEDLLDARQWLGQNDYEKFRRWTTNAENLIISLVRQHEREEQKQKKAREPEQAAKREPRRRACRARRSIR